MVSGTECATNIEQEDRTTCLTNVQQEDYHPEGNKHHKHEITQVKSIPTEQCSRRKNRKW